MAGSGYSLTTTYACTPRPVVLHFDDAAEAERMAERFRREAAGVVRAEVRAVEREGEAN